MAMEVFETKVCPQCGQELFSDMDTCYGCLYSFGKREGGPAMPEIGLADIEEPDLVGLEAGEELDSERGSGSDPMSGDAQDAGISITISTDDAQTTISVPQCGLSVGRDPLSDVVLKSRAVSRHHARVIPLSSAVIVENLGATNPTMFKGREVRETAVVHAGESFEICGSTFTVALG